MAVPLLLAAALQATPLLTLERTQRRLERTGDPIWDLRLTIP